MKSDSKSKQYKEQALTSLFLMNNTNYMAEEHHQRTQEFDFRIDDFEREMKVIKGGEEIDFF